jgi:hypothetical protein
MNLYLFFVFIIFYLYLNMLCVTFDVRLIDLFILNMNAIFNITSIFDLNSFNYNLLILSYVNIVAYKIFEGQYLYLVKSYDCFEHF